MRYRDKYMPPSDREEYIPRKYKNEDILHVSSSKDEEEIVERMPMGLSGFPDSLFILARIALAIALIVGLPFLIFAFKESIVGYIKLLVAFVIVHVCCRIGGYKISNY